jgi:hypothetical protein
MSIEDDAKEAVGNWQRFESFAWHRRWNLEDSDKWAIFNTHHRDSGLLDQSNADQIEQAMKPFADQDEPDVMWEHAGHWAVGWVDGLSIRVYNASGEITEAFRTYHELLERLEDYPVLNEEDHSRREYEATIENIEDAGSRLARNEYEDLPDGWECAVFSWFWDNDQSAVENKDDQGGYPSDDELRAAFDALGYAKAEE